MKVLALLLLAATTTVAAAEPRSTQNSRVGLLAELEFSEGSTRLPDAAGSQLGRVAAWAEENFDGVVVLDGHSDKNGDIRMSWRRARLVRDQLLALGVDPDQIMISAFGPEKGRRARVAVWGTHNTVEQMLASRRHANVVMWSRHSIPQVRSRGTSTPRGRTSRRAHQP
jgi:hypothetical protein